ncbi:MAG TPA: hypothetical protein DD490_19430 [Acidobacteria bacterium]|nr:hypothetical protein [Acidobacteriota bacterium]
MEHIERDDFVTFFTQLNRTLHARVASHLLGGCSDCLALARQVLLDRGVPCSPPSSRDLAMVLLDQAALLKEDRSRAAARWARLAVLGEKERLAAVQVRRGLRNYSLSSYLLDEAAALAKRKQYAPAAALVRLSAEIGCCLPSRVYGAGPLADLRLRQETMLANIHRLGLEFPEALKALDRAERYRDRGIDPTERAHFFRERASLVGALGDFEEAAKSAGQAAALYEGLFDGPRQGKALVQQAICVSLVDLHAALDLANEAIPLLTAEPKSLLLGSYTKCYCLAKLGQSQEAEALYAAQRERIRQVGEVEPDLWFKYIEALLLKAKGQLHDADVLLRFVALRFQEEGNLLAMLVQHLERIRIKIEAGRWKSALSIATSLTPELARLGLRNDLLGMWATLQDALAQQRDVVGEIEDFFRRHWIAPRRLARG